MELLNLQLFADPNTQVTSSLGLAPEMKTFYDNSLIKMAGPLLVHAQFGKKTPLPQGRGKKCEWRKWSHFKKATTPLTEGVTPNGTALNVTYIEAETKQYGDYTTLSDVLQLTAIDPVVVEATEKHSDNAGLTLDTITRNEIVAGTQVQYAPKVSDGSETTVTSRYDLDASARISAKEVNKAVTQLKKMNAPKINGSYVCIIHPSVAFDLRQDPAWIDAHKYSATKEIFNGEIGELHGVRFVETTEAKIFCGDDLASDSRNLAVDGDVSASSTVAFDGGTVAAGALVGRFVLIDGEKYYISANTASSMTIADPITKEATTATISDDTVIYPGEGGKEGCAVYACLFLGKEAFGVTEIEGGGLEMIIKQKGQGDDPLNQRSTVGWKHSAYTSKILINEYIVRFECGSEYSGVDVAN